MKKREPGFCVDAVFSLRKTNFLWLQLSSDPQKCLDLKKIINYGAVLDVIQTGLENGRKVSCPLEILHTCYSYSERTLIALKSASMGNRSILLFNFQIAF